MATLLSGAAFGAAMTAAGFHQPSVVISQLKFQDWRMMQAFLAATASSAVVYTIAERLGYAKLSPRSSSPLSLFAKYDGNIIGGALLGAGMALSGSCPGTLLAQLAAGAETGLYALGGAVVGGIVWTGLLSKPIKRRNEMNGVKGEATTIDQELGGISRGATLALFEIACFSVVAASSVYGPSTTRGLVAGATGGLLIGAAQLISLLTRRSMMGVSGSYEEAGNAFWWLLRGAPADTRPRAFPNVLFASGVAAGAWLLARLVPSAVAGPIDEVSPLLATVGGALMIVGSRMAGGCTSGHGISGLSLFSVSSFVTICATFGVGAIVAPLVH